MLVAVAAALLVVEAQRVQQLVLHHALLHAAKPLQRHHLLVPRTPDGRVAPGHTERERERERYYLIETNCIYI